LNLNLQVQLNLLLGRIVNQNDTYNCPYYGCIKPSILEVSHRVGLIVYSINVCADHEEWAQKELRNCHQKGEETNMKQMHFQVPLSLYEAFHRVFPGRGEKSLFFRKVMKLAVEKAEGKSAFIEEIWREAEEKYG
jgi:hypothetical protein